MKKTLEAEVKRFSRQTNKLLLLEDQQMAYEEQIEAGQAATANRPRIANMKFKKGAFFSLRSVQPVVLKYSNFYPVNIENCTMPIYYHFILVSSIIKGTAQLLEFPVFRPNDYFFKHHQREGEQKWETYARAVREIMTTDTGLKLIETNIEDKYPYKASLFPTSTAKASD